MKLSIAQNSTTLTRTGAAVRCLHWQPVCICAVGMQMPVDMNSLYTGYKFIE